MFTLSGRQGSAKDSDHQLSPHSKARSDAMRFRRSQSFPSWQSTPNTQPIGLISPRTVVDERHGGDHRAVVLTVLSKTTCTLVALASRPWLHNLACSNGSVTIAVLALRIEGALGVEERVGEVVGEFGEVFFLPLQFVEQLIFNHCRISLLRLGGREN